VILGNLVILNWLSLQFGIPKFLSDYSVLLVVCRYSIQVCYPYKKGLKLEGKNITNYRSTCSLDCDSSGLNYTGL